MTSTNMEAHLDNYFESLNTITKKITQDIDTLKKGLGEANWEQLTIEEQEDILERYLVDPHIKEKYSYVRAPEPPQVFPTMKIKSGEKIVVDFENDDGWTWTDEHSGPFSWMSRSQQDLTLEDLDNLDEQGPKKSKARGRSRSPERIEAKHWDSTYAGVPELVNGKKTNAEAANTADEIFQKFGIAFSFGTEVEEEKNQSTNDMKLPDTSQSAPAQHYQNFNILLEEEERASTVSSYVSTPAEEAKSELGDDDVDDYSLSRGMPPEENHMKQKETKDRHNSQQRSYFINTDKEEEEVEEDGEEEHYQRLIFPSGSPASYSSHTSPVFIEEPGESSTDRLFSSSHLDSSAASDVNLQADSPAVFGSSLDPFRSVITEQPVTSSDRSPPQQDTNSPSDEAAQKTGFDFLDNW